MTAKTDKKQKHHLFKPRQSGNPKGLTANQRLFVDQYLIDRNATRSYLGAYPSVKTAETAGVNGNRLLRNAKIQAAIDSALGAQQKRLEISADRTLLETARIAFVDIRKLFDESGALKDTVDLDDDIAAAIASVKVRRVRGADGEWRDVPEYKFWDKNAALDKLGRHFKLFTERTEITGADGGPISLEQKVAAMKEILDEIEGSPHGLGF